MSTQNGQNVCPKCKSVHTPEDARHVSKKSKKDLHPNELKFLEFIKFQNALELIYSLEWVHNTAIYHSHLHIEEEEKYFLFNVKQLMDKLDCLVLLY